VNTVEVGEAPNASSLGVWPSRVSSPHRGNHQILCGMLGRNKLEYLGVVSGPFEQGGAQCISDKLRLPLTQDAVPERLGERRRQRLEEGQEGEV